MKDAWVAVAPNESSAAQHNQVKRAISAFQFFQKDAAQQIKQERAVSSIAEHAQLVQAKWKALTKEQRDHYDKLHQEDVLRFQRESAAADEAAAARVRAKQAERDQLVVDGNRTTRKEAQTLPPKKKRPKVVDPALLAKKQETEDYIRARQDTLRQQRSSQAKRRLEYLLSQGGNIFSHFGSVREDTAKYGIRKQDRREGAMTRREQAEEEEEEVLDEQEATFLTKQPETLGFGKMRDYQLEGLNWMIRLQENGVNGILADGKSQQHFRKFKIVILRDFARDGLGENIAVYLGASLHDGVQSYQWSSSDSGPEIDTEQLDERNWPMGPYLESDSLSW